MIFHNHFTFDASAGAVSLSAIVGMKALVVDTETSAILSLIASQTEILEYEVYVVERIETGVRANTLTQGYLSIFEGAWWCFPVAPGFIQDSEISPCLWSGSLA